MHIASDVCVITVNTVGPPELASWYSLYLAAMAIDAMCVRQGLGGLVSRLGEGCQMTRSKGMCKADPFLGSDGGLVVSIGQRDPQIDMAAIS